MSNDPETLSAGQRAIKAARLSLNGGYTRDAACVKLDVSRGSYDRAVRVLAHAHPEVVIAVENGEASLNWADRMLVHPQDKQQALVHSLKPGHKKKTVYDRSLIQEGDDIVIRKPHSAAQVKHNVIGEDVVHTAISNQHALSIRLEGDVHLDQSITPDEARKMLNEMRKSGGAIRTLRRLLLFRKEGKD